MLVLTRKPGEKIHVGTDITITVLDATNNKLRIGIDAPADVTILRAELRELLNHAAAGSVERECVK